MKLSSKQLIIIVVSLSLSILLLVFVLNPKQPGEIIATPTPITTNQSTFEIPKPEYINPGVTTIDELQENLGEPVQVEENVRYYDTDSTLHNIAQFENNRLSFYKEFVQEENSTQVYNSLEFNFGEPEQALYSHLTISEGDVLLAYPSRGVAFLANTNARKVWEIWYFEPTNYSDFKSKWAPAFSETEGNPNHAH